MLLWLAVTLLPIFFISCQGKGCQTLDGVWVNQLGSEMILNHTAAGKLYGQYRTRVERETGSAGYGHNDIIGACPYNQPGSTFGFAVMFKGGSSITSWTGQCVVCDGDETLVTSWLLREQVETCVEKWKSTRIGQDMFIRGKTPAYTPVGGINSLHYVEPVPRVRRDLIAPCGLQTTWHNEMGSEVILQHHPDNYISGEYRTAVERSKGSAGDSHSKVFGVGNVHSQETTFAIFVVWRNGASVTGWVGQCHLCGENKTSTLEVNWLLRQQIAKCDDNWKATSYGQNGFTKHEQKWGPRKRYGIHTPQQDGEDDELIHQASLCTTSGSGQINIGLLSTIVYSLYIAAL